MLSLYSSKTYILLVTFKIIILMKFSVKLRVNLMPNPVYTVMVKFIREYLLL
jgi:hypothetical protein